MPYHNISASLSAADMAAIKAALQTIKSKLPFLINLDENERQNILKMGDKSLAFVHKVAEYAEAHPQYRPPFSDYNEFKKDFNLTRELGIILQTLLPLTDAIVHTEMALGGECMQYSNEYYGIASAASKANSPGAEAIYTDLRSRYPRTGGGRPANIPTPPEE